MNENKQELRLRWPFTLNEVRTNSDTTLLKFIAMITMFCDHAGKMLFPQWPIMRIIGRLAFPLFAYCTAVGCVYTRNFVRYLKRMVLLALITQPIYAVALNHTVPSMYAYSFTEQPIQACVSFYVKSWTGKPSILLTLIVGMLLIYSLREKHISFFIGMALIAWLCSSTLDYGWRGVALILIFYLFCRVPVLSFVCSAAFILWWGITQGGGYHLFGVSFSMETFAVLALPLIYLPVHFDLYNRLRLPKWLAYGFYPGHMVLIYVLDKFVMK